MKTSSGLTTEAIWRERVRTWRGSGETAERFARGRDFAASTLRFWSSKLGPTESPQFVRLVPRAPEVAAVTELVVEVGVARVRVSPGFDAALLSDVVRALGGEDR